MGLSDEHRESTGIMITALLLIVLTAIGIALSFVNVTGRPTQLVSLPCWRQPATGPLALEAGLLRRLGRRRRLAARFFGPTRSNQDPPLFRESRGHRRESLATPLHRTNEPRCITPRWALGPRAVSWSFGWACSACRRRSTSRRATGSCPSVTSIGRLSSLRRGVRLERLNRLDHGPEENRVREGVGAASRIERGTCRGPPVSATARPSSCARLRGAMISRSP